MKKVNCITINTDASFHPEHKVGGYAFYIICDLFKIQKGGKFKNPPLNSQDAEIMCIGNAVYTLFAQKELPICNTLIINGDCTFAFKQIQVQIRGKGFGLEVRKMIDKLSIRLGNPKVDFRYVKAHNGTPDARSFVNDWCDKEAKKWMRISISEKTKSK